MKIKYMIKIVNVNKYQNTHLKFKIIKNIKHILKLIEKRIRM